MPVAMFWLPPLPGHRGLAGISSLSTSPFLSELPVPQKGPSLYYDFFFLTIPPHSMDDLSS